MSVRRPFRGVALQAAFLLTVSLAAVALSGCAMTDADRTRAEGAGAGAGIGAILGQVMGGNSQSTVIGALAGAVAGGIVGDQVARDKQAYLEQEKRLTQMADWARGRAAETAKYNTWLQEQIAALQETNRRLDQETLAANERSRIIAERSTRANELIKQTQDQIAQVEMNLKTVRSELAKAQSARVAAPLATGSPQNGTSQPYQQVAYQVTALDEQRQALTRAVAQLQLIDTRRD